MTRRVLKSRSLRKIFVKVPGNTVKVHYKKEKPKRARCSECGKPLKGTLRESSSKMKHIQKTKKRPSRPYPNLCSSCMRKKILDEKLQ